jgi:uncharacterized protein involved in exopolysaccharide biosynthesis
MSPLVIASVLLAGRRAILLSVVLSLAIGAAISWRFQPSYQANATLVVGTGAAAGAGQLRGLATQLGVPGGAQGAEIAPELVAKVAMSPALQRPLAGDSLDVPEAGAGKRPLAELLQIPATPGADSAAMERHARSVMSALAGMVATTADRRTGAITLSVSAPWPSMALQLAQRNIAELNRYLFGLRKQRASLERQSIEDRLAMQERRLREEEGKLGAFLERNRLYQSAPELRFEFERLQRVVTLQQQVLIGLAQAREEVLSREIQAAPSLTVLEPPLMPLEPEPRKRSIVLAVALVLGILVGVAWVLAHHATRRAMAASTPEMDALRAQLEALRPGRRAHQPPSRSS